MANEEHLAILRQGVEAWNRWRDEHPVVKPDLREADLVRANLKGADLKGADLRSANLTEANLTQAILRRANLRRANLNEADLSRADLIGANLTQAILRGANLRSANLNEGDLNGANLIMADLNGANLTQAILRGAILSDARTWQTTFGDNDLSEVKGLDTVRHEGPSTIGIDTLYRSGGKIPEVFLRGCGVPDSLIEYLPSLLGAMQPIQFYSCFISYSSTDAEFAKRLHERMQGEHLRVWFAPEDIKGGEKIKEQIDRAIQLHDRLLIVLSEDSLNSKWVKTEIRRARKVELKEQRRKLFPIRLVSYETLRDWECFDADEGEDLAVEVREYFIPDFSAWKDHDAFEAAFARLLKDLQAAEAQRPPARDATQPPPPAASQTHYP